MRCSPGMNSHFRVVLCLSFCWLLFLSSVTPAPRSTTTRRSNRAPAAPQTPAPRRANEVLVRFRGVQSSQQKNDLAAAHGLRRVRTLRGESGVEKLQLPAGTNVDTTVAQLLQDPAVESAEPNFLIAHDQLGALPNDPRNPELVFAIGQNGQLFASVNGGKEF